uniref:ALMS motif domain-containing protein n=1 Tax=Poecilia formosa TaxID=48698 RepID=A0A096LV08_POEFO
MEPQQTVTTPHRLGDEDAIGPDGQTGPPEARSQSIVQQDHSQLKIKTDVQELQLSQQNVFQLEFQDSHLSPALSLLPLIPGLEHSVTEYSFFQQGGPEFAPLRARAFPDVSMVSERLRFLIHDSTTNSSEQSSLSQHPLSQATLLSDEGASSNFSPSQHDTQRKLSSGDNKETKLETEYNLTDSNKVGIHEDETIFLHKDISMQDPQANQRQVGMQSSSSSSVSSESLTSIKSTGFCPDQPRQTEDNMSERQGPPGEASPSQQQKNHKEISNITTGSRSTQPDDSSEELHKELLSEVQKLSNFEARQHPKGPTPTQSQGKRSGKPFSAGSEWVHRDRDLWSLQNQTGSEGSYLGFLPQSQSTPGVFFVPPKFDVKTKLAHLSAIKSNIDTLGAHSADGRLPDTEDPQEASHKVHSLPSLNYLQKVDAWKTKESSERTPSLEGLALHRLSGVPPKKGDEAGFNTLIRQPSTNQDATQISSSTPSGGSSPRRGEAVGGAHGDLENKGSATPPSASPFGRSQSPSSLGTVVVVADKHQLTNTAPENKTTQGLKDTLPPPSTATQPSRFESLGRFSDVSELSSSQDSYTEIKVEPSVGTSSVVSLELDNYAPYWTFKHSATSPPPPGSKELNIDERIPLYLQNLGIDQTPSKILTPFAPRGPIREPEFSPTDLCTIKGSSGTPSKSTQPSEGSSPHKGEFSMSSILSMDSSVSIPLSMDSLGLVSSPSEQVRVKTSPPSDTEAAQRESRLASCSGPGEHSSVLIQNSKQDFKSVAVNVSDTDTKSSVRRCDNMDQDAENSFVSTKALSEIRKLLSQAEDMISTASSTSSSGPNATLLFSDKDIFRPPNTSTTQLQNSSFSSSISTFTGGDLKSHSSPPWARSSSDSILTSEKPNQSSTGLESLMSSEQPDSPSTQARRTEPEGCSAAPPDKIQTQPSTAASTTQFNAALPIDPGAESCSAFPVCEDADQGVMSDSSSESSLAIRVAKLLQNESSATMTSSTPSVTDQEEGKAREWMKSKVLGQQRDLLLLDVEDRRHIEEIKKQLLLRNPLKSQGSTDTESSSMASSVQVHKETNPPKPTEMFPTLSIANKQLAVHPDPHMTLQSNLHLDLEARVCAIAAREGITIPTQRISVTSSPSILTPTSTSALSPASDPLHLAELSTGTSSSSKHLSTSLDESETVPLVQITREPPSAHDESTRKRRDTVGGQGEEPPQTATQAVDKQNVGTNVQSSSFLAVGQGFRTRHFTLLPKNILASTAHCPGSGAATAALRDSSLTASRTDVSTIDPQGKGITPSSSYPAETPEFHTLLLAVLLPYKPRGSEELFYVPQMEADVCSTNRTNTTMESSHTGSDDAVPPTFSSEVLGDQDPRLDRGIAFRHQEGIYSKRLRTAAVTMADRAHTGEGVKPSSQESSTFTRAPSINLKPSSRDQGTSPIHFPQCKPTELAHDRFHPARLETAHTETRDREHPPPALRQGTSTLDHLWQKFCDQRTKDEARPTGDKDISLLERLERLSRVIHRTQAAQTPRKERKEIKWSEHGGVTERGWEVGGGEAEHPTQLNHPSSPADRDQPDSLSSTSTVDTARLVRAFGADRVRNVNSSSRLGKLYSTINKQREDWRGKEADSSVTLTPSEESVRVSERTVVADSAQTSSSHTFSPQRRPSRTLTAKRAVRAVNKSIQAGELEIVRNGTRRNTRDVGTTFPSPAEARTCGQTSSSSSGTVGGRGGRRVLPKSNNQKQKKSKRSPSKPYPKSVSWFIPVDNLRSEMRKENRPEKMNTAWLEPYSRTRPWRELLRQRQVRDLNPKTKVLSSGLARVSLQEALEMRRPDFISQSKQRVRCLALQAEDRRIQAARNLLFDQLEEPQRLPRPAVCKGTALLRRAVPRKEMIQRSKQIYENLPEVRRRREEERRKAEYQTYRLNAKLYNKKIKEKMSVRIQPWQ